MDQDPTPPPGSRENMLAIALVAIVAGAGLFYLYMITLGIVANVLAVGGGVIILGAFHYVVWGKSFSAEVAAEREALRRQDERDAQPKPKVRPDAIQDITRTQGIQKK